MAQRYDAVIIGGGHNGLVSAAYLARAGWKTLVLEQRHVLGGAAVTEEIFPGFKFSVCSYVVSLLRPEIIRDLELAKHGLEMLPLDGTFTPLEGDYLWRVNDHAKTMRELRRWSRTDAEAYELYGPLMVEMARFIKPILGIVPPDLAGLDPRQTFERLLEPGHLPDDFVAEVHRYKYRGSSGKVNLALDALPEFTCLPGPGDHLRGAISFSPNIEYMERAYDDAKYGHWSRRPYIDVIIPTLVDPAMAPPGKHVMSCFVQYAPYKLEPELGSWDDHREAFGDAVIDTIAERAPNIRDIILHRQVLTPLDWERTIGLSEGNIFQGELTLEQLFFNRPAPGWARYRTPLRDLWMGGSATHPGGGIMGGPGRLAALEILKAHRGKAA